MKFSSPRSFAFIALLGVAAWLALPTAQADNSKTAKPAAAITFTKDVAPILFKNCAQCHKPDDIAPFSVLSYKDVRPWAKSIREQVVARAMPPWHADPNHGDFENNPRLSEAEINTIAAWVDGGAREGNAKDLPAMPDFKTSWEIGQPDVVLTMPHEYELPAKGADDYIYFRVPTGFTEDRWVQAAEFRPGNRRVVHHAVVFIETPAMYRMAQDIARKTGRDVQNPISVFEQDGSPSMTKEGTVQRTKTDAPVVNDACSTKQGNSGGSGIPILSAYAPGRNADVYPTGTAKRIPAGANLIFQMHYAKTTGKPEKDQTSMALSFAKQPVAKMVETLLIVNELFAIPPGAENHAANACYTFRRDVELINYMPHMHVRGKAMKYEVVRPDGQRETLINIAPYNFNWQTLYKLKQPVPVAKGSRVIVSAVFDNSAKNKLNPDPTKTVRFGEPTYDEMLVGFIDYARPKPVARTVAKIDPKIYDAYVGEYALGLGPKFSIERDGAKLMFVIQGQGSFEALPESETKFFFQEIEDASVVFVKNERGEVVEMQAQFGAQHLKAKRVVKPVNGSK